MDSTPFQGSAPLPASDRPPPVEGGTASQREGASIPRTEAANHAEADLAAPAPDLVVIGRRDLRSNNSWMHNLPVLAKGPRRCTALVHPADAARYGVTDAGAAGRQPQRAARREPAQSAFRQRRPERRAGAPGARRCDR